MRLTYVCLCCCDVLTLCSDAPAGGAACADQLVDIPAHLPNNLPEGVTYPAEASRGQYGLSSQAQRNAAAAQELEAVEDAIQQCQDHTTSTIQLNREEPRI